MCHSPAPETPQPFHLISNNTADIEAMKQAEQDPQLIMLSDWDHLTFEEYQQIQVASNLNVLSVENPPYTLEFLLTDLQLYG